MPFETNLIVDEAGVTLNSDGRLVKTFHRRHRSKSTEEINIDAVHAAIGVLPGAPHPTWPYATCRSIKSTREMTREPHCAWITDYEYSTEAAAPSDESTSSTDPTARNVKRRTGTMQQQRFIIRDRLGVMITDAAGSPFDGGVPVTDYLGTLVFERDEVHSSTSMSQAVVLSGKINSDTYMGCSPGTLMMEVNGDEKREGSYHFWSFTYSMVYDKDGWQPRPANAGLYERHAGGVRRITFDGKPAQEPQPLFPSTSSGRPGEMIPNTLRPAACNFIEVDHYNTLAFSSLGLPTT